MWASTSGEPCRSYAPTELGIPSAWVDLVGPSYRTWYTWARGIKEDGALPEGLAPSSDPNKITMMGARLRQLAEKAALARTTSRYWRTSGPHTPVTARADSKGRSAVRTTARYGMPNGPATSR